MYTPEIAECIVQSTVTQKLKTLEAKTTNLSLSTPVRSPAMSAIRAIRYM